VFCLVLQFRKEKWTFAKVEEVMWTFSYLYDPGSQGPILAHQRS